MKEISNILETQIDELSTFARMDKIALSGILIEDIVDFTALEEAVRLTNGKGKMKYLTKSGKEFTNLAIKDDYFGSLKAGVNYAKNWIYSKFSTSVKNDYLTNLVCNSVKDYHRQVEDAKKYLIEKYGVYTDFTKSTVSSIEVNRTFKVDHNINDYKRIFELIAWNVPRRKRMTLVDDISIKTADKLETQTFRITSKKCVKNQNGKTTKSKQFEEIVFYSKSKQIEKIIMLSAEHMRVEIRVVGLQKIKSMLGTNKFYDLTDQIINDFFDREIKELIINPYASWKKKRDETLVKLLKQQRSDDQKNWIVNTLLYLANNEIENGFPMVLDVKEVFPIIDKIGIEDAKRRYKIRQAFKRQALRRASVFCKDDDLKVQELLEKLQGKAKDGTALLVQEGA